MSPRRSGHAEAALPAVLLLAVAACRCGAGEAGQDGGVETRDATVDEGCDLAACTAACRASGAECGRCVDGLGCRCGTDCDADAGDDSGGGCPPDSVAWPYPPIWERHYGEEWAFDPPKWDVSALRSQPVPGCEHLSLGAIADSYAYRIGNHWVDAHRMAVKGWVTVCTESGPDRGMGLYLLDTADWTLRPSSNRLLRRWFMVSRTKAS